MADWFAFIVTVGTESIRWLGAMEIMGVPVAGFLVGCFILGVLFRAFLYKP